MVENFLQRIFEFSYTASRPEKISDRPRSRSMYCVVLTSRCRIPMYVTNFNFPLASCSFVRLESPAEIYTTTGDTRGERHTRNAHVCACAQASFGRSRRVCSISRAFPFFSVSQQQPTRAQLVCTRCVGACARLVAVPCRCMQILSPNFSKCTAQVYYTGERGRGRERVREEGREAINCGSSRGTVTRPRRRLRNCGCHDIDTSVPDA